MTPAFFNDMIKPRKVQLTHKGVWNVLGVLAFQFLAISILVYTYNQRTISIAQSVQTLWPVLAISIPALFVVVLIFFQISKRFLASGIMVNATLVELIPLESSRGARLRFFHNGKERFAIAPLGKFKINVGDIVPIVYRPPKIQEVALYPMENWRLKPRKGLNLS